MIFTTRHERKKTGFPVLSSPDNTWRPVFLVLDDNSRSQPVGSISLPRIRPSLCFATKKRGRRRERGREAHVSPRPSSWNKKGRQEDDISRDDPEFEKNNLSLSLSVGSDVFPRGNILRDPEVSFSPRVCPSARHVGIVLPAKVKLSRTRCVFLYFRSVNGHRRYPS